MNSDSDNSSLPFDSNLSYLPNTHDNFHIFSEENKLLSYNENYIRPALGKNTLIYILDFQRMIACWLPGIRRTVYMTHLPDSDEFKRPREILLISVYEFAGNQIGSIEIGKADYNAFFKTYEKYLKKGGEIYYRREKEIRRIKHIFELHNSIVRPKKVKCYKMLDLL